MQSSGRSFAVHTTTSVFVVRSSNLFCGRPDRLELVKLEFHDADTDTDILARILADTSDTRDFLKLFLWQAERHADILATILSTMSVSGVGVGAVECQLYQTTYEIRQVISTVFVGI